MATTMFWLWVCSLAILFHESRGCGTVTHIEITYRAQDQFQPFQTSTDYEKLLFKHQDALEAGSPYPDAYYPNICAGGKYHDIAEDTHWTPFMNATINYIRKRYPPPWDEATEKLVVFLLGVVSHQVADVSWHGLGIDQGFLDAMGGTNFHGSFDAAHSVGDIGGDIMTVYEFALSHMPYVTEWYVPVDDLMNIYEELYGTVRLPRDVIIECTQLLFAERFGEKLALDKLYPDYAAKSPYLVDQLTDYFLGGLDDMAVWTQNVWREAIHMLDKGTEVCDIDKNPLYIHCNWGQKPGKKSTKRPEKNGFYKEPRFSHLREEVVFKNTLRGVSFSPSPKLQEALYMAQKQRDKQLWMKGKKRDGSLKASQHRSPDAVYSINNTYAKLGWSMTAADLDGDGNEDVVIGAPGYRYMKTPQAGAVFIVYGTDNGLPLGDLDLKHSADVFLPGREYVNGRFGSSVAVLDVNQDGVLDIAVGAPSVGSSTLSYQGEVSVYYGIGNRTFTFNMTVQCLYHYCNLGRALAAADLNGDGFMDLLMGAPFAGHGGDQRGIVTALLSDKKYKGYHAMITTDQLYWTYTGSQNYSWFGYDLSTYSLGDGTTMVFVSEPTCRQCGLQNCSFSQNDTQSVGRLNFFSTHKGKPPTLGPDIMGALRFQAVGVSSAVGKPYPDGSLILAMGSSGQNVHGSVAGIGIKFVQAGTVDLYNLTNLNQDSLSTFSGDRRFSRFGSKVMFSDLNGDGFDDLVIGAPLRTEDITEEIVAGEEGGAYVFFGGPSFAKGKDPTSNCDGDSLVKPCPGDSASVDLMFGEDRARFGAGFVAVKSKTQVSLLVTALHSSHSARLSGAVAVYSFHHG